MNFAVGTNLYHYVLDLEDKAFTCYPCEIAYIKYVDSGSMSWNVAYIRKHFNGRDIYLKLNMESIGLEKIRAGKYLWLTEKDDEKAKSMFRAHYEDKVSKSMKKFMSDAENFSKVYDIFGLDFPTIDIPASPFGNV